MEKGVGICIYILYIEIYIAAGGEIEIEKKGTRGFVIQHRPRLSSRSPGDFL